MLTALPRLTSAVLAVLVLALIAWRSADAGPAPAPAAPEPVRIGMVDIQKLADGLLEATAKNDQLKDKAKAFEQQQTQYNTDLKKIDDDLQLIGDKSSPQARAKITEREELKGQAQGRLRSMKRDLELQAADSTGETYQRIVEALSRYAPQEGYELILTDDRHSSPKKGMGPEEVTMRIEMRKVLYAAPRVDVTEGLQ